MSNDFATRLVWLDALVTNPDRTHRNPNLLIWERRPWLIDHGSALYAHHDWPTVNEARIRTPFPQIEQHVLLPRSGDLEAVDSQLTATFTDDLIARVLALVPEALLLDPLRAEFAAGGDARARYFEYLTTRLRAPRAFVAEAVEARERLRRGPVQRLSARR